MKNHKSDQADEQIQINVEQMYQISKATVSHYNHSAIDFWENTRQHDVSENYNAFLNAIEAETPYSILDFGCGPGRDLHYFRSIGHNPTGLEGSETFVSMAKSFSGCEVIHQNFLTMELHESYFDGVFANASLFHVPRQELPRVLKEIFIALKPRGVLFSSNPHGNNQEEFDNKRYCCFLDLNTWRYYVTEAGFRELLFYYRPTGLPRDQQPWLATLWQKP